MAVHKPKFKNIPAGKRDSFVKHHLPYELWMMRDSLKAALAGAPTRFLQNLQVEGFALHARNLIEFLKDGDGCGFNPTDFTKSFSVDRKFVRDTLVGMINKQISHLTVDRTENQEEKFDQPEWKETAAAIEKEFERWTQHLTPEWAAKWKLRERMGEAMLSLSLENHAIGASAESTFLKNNQGSTTSVGKDFKTFMSSGKKNTASPKTEKP